VPIESVKANGLSTNEQSARLDDVNIESGKVRGDDDYSDAGRDGR
jgi:hypothetical protein